MLNDDDLYDFAKSCAYSYYRRFGSSDLEEATQDAALYLVENRENWTKPRNYLRKRVVFVLVRKYQNEKGLRRKNKIRKIELDVFLLAARLKDETNRDEARSLIDSAIRSAGLEYAHELIELLIDGWTRKDVRKRFNVSFREVSEIWNSFLYELKKTSFFDPETDKELHPLFYPQDSANGTNQPNRTESKP